ncbi:MAG: efflux RND transporter periplasmic adaptor subunit [Woeseiaceae bacterium]
MKPPPESKDTTDVAPLVNVITLDAADTSFRIESQGTIQPRTETTLSAEISGAIVGISPKFVAGGVFRQGEELLRIDQSNYAAAVDRANAMLEQRRIEFEGAEKLRSQGYRAESEYASAVAALAAARADLVNAERNLERTVISLPYDGMVRTKSADLGQYVNPGTMLGVTFATDFAEVRLPLTDQDLAFIDLPNAADIQDSGSSAGPSVALSAIQQGELRSWPAQIVRTEGVVDEKNRVTYAVASVADPYHLGRRNGGDSALPVGTFVAASIVGTTVSNVIRVPRIALRGNRQLMFVDSEDRLYIRDVDILRSDSEYAYLRGGASVGDRISLTTIESPLNGMKVRTIDSPDVESQHDDQESVADVDKH